MRVAPWVSLAAVVLVSGVAWADALPEPPPKPQPAPTQTSQPAANKSKGCSVSDGHVGAGAAPLALVVGLWLAAARRRARRIEP